MKDHKNNMPPQPGQPPAPPPEKPRKRGKRRRRGPSFGFIFLLIIIIGIGAFVALWKNGFIHFGKDDGTGSGDGSGTATVVSNASTDSEASAESTVVEIKVDEEKIYLDGAEVANAEELKNKITEIGDKKTYNFVHYNAINATYDEVKAVLTELETALNIKVNYNDET